ncbi:hypothetical protein [Spirulina major]|uniref:hypothetical protein n=1 Tax=Spirulina major TaxID=270636 RepID=UPI0009335A10|nr:hypothetical protein [Spirulina major]
MILIRKDLYSGTAFRWSENAYKTKHLWITLDDPEIIDNAEKVLAVNVTSVKEERPLHNDLTVLLQPGDHPYIKRPLFIFYAYTRFFCVDTIIRYINEENTLEDDINDVLLQRIRVGLLVSDNAPIEIQERYQEKFKPEH